MLKGIAIAAVIGIAIIVGYYVLTPQFTPKSFENDLSQTLNQIQNGLTYDKFINMADSQRDAIVQKMPQNTINLILGEAKKFPTTVSESIQDMTSKISNDTQSFVYSKQGTFVGMGGNEAKGKAMIISVGGPAFLRFQDFQVTNGPDLHIYMTRGGNMTTGIDLGKLKGSIGDQNYALSGVDLKSYDTVVIFCKPFQISFAEAKIA